MTTIAFDVIEFNVARPPTIPVAARQLAWEQYVYCPDIVDQGVRTLENLTASLKDSPNWFFCWDGRVGAINLFVLRRAPARAR